jgi:hypothetical protein
LAENFAEIAKSEMTRRGGIGESLRLAGGAGREFALPGGADPMEKALVSPRKLTDVAIGRIPSWLGFAGLHPPPYTNTSAVHWRRDMLFESIVSNVKIQALLIVSAALLSACASSPTGGVRIGDTPARRIAKDSAIPGKYVENQCLPFANALHAKFQAAGIPSKVISFSYETLPTPREIIFEPRPFPSVNDRGGLAGAHAVVVYEDLGRTYVMDNQSWQPKWIHDGSPTEMAQQFGGMDMKVGDARVSQNTRHSKVKETRVASSLPSFHAPAPALLAGLQ